MSSLTIAALALACATAGAAPAADLAPAPAPCAGANVTPSNPALRQVAADAVLCLINVERAKRGLAPVRASSLLTKAAAFHSGDMVRRQYFSHITPSGQGLRQRVAKTGYLRGARRPALAETLAWGADVYAKPDELVKELMESSVHRAIVTDRRFRDIGVGLALGAPMAGMGQGATLALNFGRR